MAALPKVGVIPVVTGSLTRLLTEKMLLDMHSQLHIAHGWAGLPEGRLSGGSAAPSRANRADAAQAGMLPLTTTGSLLTPIFNLFPRVRCMYSRLGLELYAPFPSRREPSWHVSVSQAFVNVIFL